MPNKPFHPKDLDKVIEQTIKAVEMGKEQIYEIVELAKGETLRVQAELEKLKVEINQIIDEQEKMEATAKKARIRLMEVHRDFRHYTEDEVRKAYEFTQEIQIKLAVLRQQEKGLRQKRDDMERQLRNLQQTISKAEGLASQVNIAVDYLKGSLGTLSDQLDKMQKRQEIAIWVIQAQEEERRRVAREIHDGPAQSMANVVLRIEVCERLWEVDQNRVKEELRNLKEIVRESLREVRQIIFDLRPMALDDLGLVPTLRRYIENLRMKGSPEIDFLVSGQEGEIPSAYKAAVFRIVQEALNNALKHSNAKHAVVELKFSPEWIKALIKDDGCGFCYEEVEENPHDRFGLLGMKERVDLLGGSIEIKTGKGEGTAILVEIPLMKSLEVKEDGGNQSVGG